MRNLLRIPAVVIVSWLVAVSFAACGGGSSSGQAAGSSTETVAKVGNAAITRTTVSHRMAIAIGLAVYNLKDHAAFTPLVSDPPNFPACESHLATLVAHAPLHLKPLPTSRLMAKCHRLYEALKLEATSYLVQSQWQIELDRELGIAVTEQEVMALLRRTHYELFPTETALASYLTSRNMTLSDELFELKLDLLAQKTLRLVESGHQGLLRAQEAAVRQTQRITCAPGYVVQHCREYRRESTASQGPPASELIAQLVAIASGVCNEAACRKQ